jgi:hypothetical protein
MCKVARSNIKVSKEAALHRAMMKHSRMTKPDVDTNNADTSAPFQGCPDGDQKRSPTPVKIFFL